MYFKYKAINNEGKVVKSFIEADNEKEVLKITKKLNLNIVSVAQVKAIKKEKVKSRDILIFTRLFSRLVKSHISVIRSLKIIQQNIDNITFKNIINNIIGYIEKGDSLSKALGKYKYVFSSFFCAVIKAGENSGHLDITLELLFKYLQTKENTKKKFQTALFYPLFVLALAVVILSLIFIFVVPQFRTLFSMFDTKLPALTELLFGMSIFVKNNFFYILGFFILAGILIKILLKTARGRQFKDRFILKVPLIGKLIRESIYTKFCQILALLVQSNVNILLSFEILEEIMSNSIVKNKIKMIHEQVKNGKSITDAFTSAGFFPATVIQMVKAGEESGDMDEMLESAAQFYEENLAVKIELFSSILQPVLIIIIGIFIAIIIISIFLPVFQLGTVLN